jgi:hypothetical protein
MGATVRRKTRWFWGRFESVIGRPAMAVDGKWPGSFLRRPGLRIVRAIPRSCNGGKISGVQCFRESRGEPSIRLFSR